MTDAVMTPEFWDDRLSRASAVSEKHRAVYDCSLVDWQYLQDRHREILHKLFDTTRPNMVLDVGCGLGDIVPLLPQRVLYTGIDVCPRFIEIARSRHPDGNFLVGDMRRLPFGPREFDWVVLRSVEGMIKTEMGIATWREVEAEVMRVSDRLLLLNYSQPHLYRVVDSVPDPEAHALCAIECDGGRLLYRAGMDGCHELYDLMVDEEKRMRGIGRSLVRRLEDRTFGSVYGFTRIENEGAQRFYRRCGYTLLIVPRLYRGQDGFLFVKECLRDVRAI